MEALKKPTICNSKIIARFNCNLNPFVLGNTCRTADVDGDVPPSIGDSIDAEMSTAAPRETHIINVSQE